MMQKLLKIVFIIAFQFFAFPQTSSNFWYVSTTGLGSKTGADSSNAAAIANMNNLNIQPGDFVYVIEGDYNNITFTPQISGTSSALVTYMGNPTNSSLPVFRGNTVGIDIDDVSYIKVKNLKTTNNYMGVDIDDPINVVYLDSVVVRKVSSAGISFWGNYGVSPPPSNCQFDSLFIRWCDVESDSQYNSQTDVMGGAYFDNLFILNNRIVQSNVIGTGHNDNIQFGDGIGRVVIANNYLANVYREHSQVGMLNVVYPGDTMIVYNNVQVQPGVSTGLAFDCAGWGGPCIGSAGAIYLIHNTLIHSGGSSPAHCHMTEPFIAKNNIFYSSGVDGVWVLDPFESEFNEYDYNVIYSGGSTTYPYCNPSGSSRTLAWMQAKGVSANDLPTTDMKFTDYASGDYTLQATSPAKNYGTDLQALVESFGLEWKSFDNPYVSWSNPVLRGSNPSVGAWEFAGGGGGGNYPPYSPTNPSPTNGATAQPLNLTMTWTCIDPDGDPLTYDVYFGTGNNPPLVSSNQSNASFNPGNLITNTTYYWKIVAKDNQGHTTSGPLWNFATIVVDVTPPEVISAALLDSVTLRIIFSEPLEQSGAQNTGNYTITNGINISTASLSGSEVILTTSAHSVGSYTVTVNNVTDLSGNMISPTANFANYEWIILPQSPVKLEIIAVSASSTNSPNYPPENTIDGLGYFQNPESCWAALPMSQHLIFDLGSEKEFTQTRFSFYRFNLGRNYIYSIFATNDTNATWTQVLDQVQSISEEWTIESFPSVSARFIKLLLINSIPSQSWANIYEAEIWGLDGVVYVELTSFNASYSEGKVNLVWTTSSETNCYGFEVQRRGENFSYEKIGFVNGNGTTNNGHTYNYIDQNLSESKYFYRLKELTHDGDYQYSNEIMIDIPELSSFELQQNYPNPFNPSTNIAIRMPYKTYIKLAVYNMLGELVVEVADGEFDSGTHVFKFNADGLTSGIYFYRLESENFADTKKMILLR